jgi:hypothetical protein
MKPSIKYYYVTLLIGLAFWPSCMNIRELSRGNLSENATFNFYYYNYVDLNLGQKNTVKSCKVYLTHIKNSEKKIKEAIVWYSCDTLLPIKYFLTTDTISGTDKLTFMIADTSNNFLTVINEDEKAVFLRTNKYLSKLGYSTYDIRGFKFLTTEVTMTGFPFLATTIKYYKK